MKRVPLQRKTPLRHKGTMKRSRIKRKPAPPGFPETVRAAVRRRSGNQCEACSSRCTGRAQHFHHRKPRRSKDHSLENCLHVCSACHDYIHANPMLSYVMGWMVRQEHDPAEIVVKRGDGVR